MSGRLINRWTFLAFACATAAVCLALHPPERGQAVVFTVAAPEEDNIAAFVAEVQHAGRTVKMSLTPHPGPDRSRVWEGEWTVPAPTLLLPVRLLTATSTGGPPKEVAHGLEVLRMGRTDIAWSMKTGAVAIRLSPSGTVAQVMRHERRTIAGKMGAAIGVLLLVLWMVRAAERKADSSGLRFASDFGLRTSNLADLLFWLLLSVAWTWPAALADREHWVGLQCDTLSTVWVLDAAPRLVKTLTDTMTGWPVGFNWAHLDSFTLLPLGAALHWLGAARLHGLLQIAGVALSAWAAQGFARRAGAARPWDILGGAAYAFSGLSANALLEGYVYQAVNPWLPLFATFWLKALSPVGRARDGALAGVMFCLTLLTSAYLGLAAAIVAVGFWIGSVARQRAVSWRPTMAAALVVLPAGIGYAAFYGHGNGVPGRDLGSTGIHQASAHLLSLAGATPELDRTGQSLAVELSPVILALVIVAPVVLKGRPGYRTILWTAVAGLALAVGPMASTGVKAQSLPTPLSLLLGTPLQAPLHFPLRMAWVWNLCAGALAALVAAELARRGTRWGVLLVLLALLHPFVAIDLPARQAMRPVVIPSAYAQSTGPALDLFPFSRDGAGIETLYLFSALGSAYQAGHGRPIADRCIDTGPFENHRARLNEWATAGLLSEQPERIREGLGALGFSAVAFHSDLFNAEDRDLLDAALEKFGTARVISTNSGSRVVLQAVDANTRETPAPLAAYRARLAATPARDRQIDTLHPTPKTVLHHTAASVAAVGWTLYLLIAAGWHIGQRRKSRT